MIIYDSGCSIKPRRERWASASQAYLEAVYHDTDLLLAAIDEVFALNVTAEKSALTDGAAQARLLLDVKNARELLAVLCNVGRPGFEKTVTYACVFYDLLARIQDQRWRLAEIRSNSLSETIAARQCDSVSTTNPDSEAALDAAKSFGALYQYSLDTMRTAGKQLAAMMARNVATMTLTSVQISNTAKKEIEVFLRDTR